MLDMQRTIIESATSFPVLKIRTIVGEVSSGMKPHSLQLSTVSGFLL